MHWFPRGNVLSSPCSPTSWSPYRLGSNGWKTNAKELRTHELPTSGFPDYLTRGGSGRSDSGTLVSRARKQQLSLKRSFRKRRESQFVTQHVPSIGVTHEVV